MKYTLQKLNQEIEGKYNQFLINDSKSLLYASVAYKNLLRDFIQAEDNYFLALDENGHIRAALPTFILRTSHGNIANSLPFYGSNGGIIYDNFDAACFLLDAFDKFCRENNCLASTIISSPFDKKLSLYNSYWKPDFIDNRIGQITKLPRVDQNLEDIVMGFFDSKNRNMIRKAQKSNISVCRTPWEGCIDFLAQVHANNMHDIGGIAKPISFFNHIHRLFQEGKDYKIYTARLNGNPIAALLVFYFNRTVEYFTPVIVKEHRSLQPLSLIIYQAFYDSIKDGFSWWNWGGTWESQTGVYQFKKSWGATDFPYQYYTRVYNKEILHKSVHELLDYFPYFFVVPFGQLDERKGSIQL